MHNPTGSTEATNGEARGSQHFLLSIRLHREGYTVLDAISSPKIPNNYSCDSLLATLAKTKIHTMALVPQSQSQVDVVNVAEQVVALRTHIQEGAGENREEFRSLLEGLLGRLWIRTLAELIVVFVFTQVRPAC